MRYTFVFLVLIVFGCSSTRKLTADFTFTQVYEPASTLHPVSNQKLGRQLLTANDQVAELSTKQHSNRKKLSPADSALVALLDVQERLASADNRKERKEIYQEMKSLAYASSGVVMQDSSRWDENTRKAQNNAVASLTFAALSILFLPLLTEFVPLFLVLSVITGSISLKKYKRSFNKEYRTLALIGLILSGTLITVALIAVLALLYILFSFGML